MRTLACTVLLCAATLGAGCSFHARDAESYRRETRALLETRNPDIKACYDAALKGGDKPAGLVVVKFTVAKETGKLTGASVVAEQSTAPAGLGECVVKAIDGLTLDPPDARDGDATFQWAFEIKG